MRSKFEKDVAKLLKKRKVKFAYEAEKIPYIIEANYIPDFKTESFLIECKGVLDPIERRKLLAIKRCNPALDIRLWFMRDNWLTKAKKMRYSDWATKHGFPYHVGLEFPRKWF